MTQCERTWRQNVEAHSPEKIAFYWENCYTKKITGSAVTQRVNLFAQCLHRLCVDYISYRIRMRHMSARTFCCWCCLFQFHNDIIDICILMNILPCIYIILCKPLSSPLLCRHCFSIQLYLWAHSQFAVISANNIQFEFDFVKMNFFTGHWLCKLVNGT